MVDVEGLKAAVAAQTSVQSAVVTLLEGLADALSASNDSVEAVQDVVTQMRDSAPVLATAVLANTPPAVGAPGVAATPIPPAAGVVAPDTPVLPSQAALGGEVAEPATPPAGQGDAPSAGVALPPATTHSGSV